MILLVFNAKEELSNDDHRLVSLIRRVKKKIIVLNKTEGNFNSNIISDIEKFGFGLPILISSAHMKSIDILEEKILQTLN